MNVDISSLKRPQGLFLAAAVLRLALFFVFPGLPELVAGRVEVSTPVNSFKRRRCSLPSEPAACKLTSDVYVVQEGLFLFNHNVSPYDGGVYHQAPLLLPLFSLLPSFASWPVFTYLLYIAVDLLSAGALITIAGSGEAGTSALFTSPRKDKRWSGTVVAALYVVVP